MPNLERSPTQNALSVSGNTPMEFYFNRPKNLAFHDLTSGKVMPKAVKPILGLSHKFIPVPKVTPSNMTDALDRLERDIDLKVNFADSPIESEPPPFICEIDMAPPPCCNPKRGDTSYSCFQPTDPCNISPPTWKKQPPATPAQASSLAKEADPLCNSQD